MISVVVVAQVFFSGAVFAVPSNREAWSDLDKKITVYGDSEDTDLYWFIPRIRFEANEGKTVLRPKTLASGKVEYTVRIIPYFSKDLRELVAQNISNIRQGSQLKPVVAKNIGIALPDFNYKFSSPSVTSYQYLDVPRLVRFQLDAEEAATFDELYNDDLGVPVEFTISYDGVMTDKFYNIDVNCKEMARELSTNFKPRAGVGANVKGANIYLGADLEFAFLNTVQNRLNGVNITSKGDLPGMQEMLRRVMNLCFDLADGSGPYDSGERDNTGRRTRTGGSDDGNLPERRGGGEPGDDGLNRRQFAGTGIDEVVSKLDLDQDPPSTGSGGEGEGSDPGLLPKAQLRMGYILKKTALDRDNQAVIHQVALKDTIATTTIVDVLSTNARAVEKVNVQPLADKKFAVTTKNQAPTPLMTGIRIHDGEQYTINAEFIFNAVSGYSPWKAKQYAWDSSWEKTDGDLYYRLGSGDWTPVNRRTIITSDVTRGGGELQFYLDRSSIYNKIPEKLRKGTLLAAPAFTLEGIAPEFSVQVSGRRIEVR